MTLNQNDVREILLAVCDRVIEKESWFCRLDSVVGDGDHGVTMTRGFKAMREATRGEMSVKELLETAGAALGASMGGAIGPIYGVMLKSMGMKADTKPLTARKLAEMLEQSRSMVQVVANVQEGQKTIYDAFSPAVTAFAAEAEASNSIPAAAERAAEAAKQGADATMDMTAKKGRARFLGERSKGHIDAGAASFSVISETISSWIKNKDMAVSK